MKAVALKAEEEGATFHEGVEVTQVRGWAYA